MAKFAGYGFNKSHAAAYALVAYQTAYLKANYPVEFLAASMTARPRQYRQARRISARNCDRLGIALLPPDINRSEVTFAVEEPIPKSGQARDPLRARRGQGGRRAGDGRARRRARRARPVQGPRSISRARLDAKSFNRRQFESLVKAGAFDCLNPNRAQSFAAAELLLRQASRAAEERESRQESLFAGIDRELCAAPVIAAGGGLAAGRETAARIRRDRLLPVEPPARPLRQEPRARRHPALGRSAGGARGQRRRPASGSPAS